MYNCKRMVYYGILVGTGIVLVLLSCLNIVPDFWSGFGGGIFAIGLVRLILGMRYRKDEGYKRYIDVQNNDERNIYISRVAKAISFYITILVLAAASLVLIILKLQTYGRILLFVVCFMVLTYFVTYIILNKKN